MGSPGEVQTKGDEVLREIRDLLFLLLKEAQRLRRHLENGFSGEIPPDEDED